LQVFLNNPPWGVLLEEDIFKLVVRENERPDRADQEVEQKVGLTDRIWEIIEASWEKDVKLRPTFAQIAQMWQNKAVSEEPEDSQPGPSRQSITGELLF
jgi:hypothetical protein